MQGIVFQFVQVAIEHNIFVECHISRCNDFAGDWVPKPVNVCRGNLSMFWDSVFIFSFLWASFVIANALHHTRANALGSGACSPPRFHLCEPNRCGNDRRVWSICTCTWGFYCTGRLQLDISLSKDALGASLQLSWRKLSFSPYPPSVLRRRSDSECQAQKVLDASSSTPLHADVE